MGNDYILSAVREYAGDCLGEPRGGLPRGCFEQRSYQKWAAGEVLKSIAESKHMPPTMAIEGFIRKMDDFSCQGGKAGIIFSVARDTALGILDMLLALDDGCLADSGAYFREEEQ